MKINIISSVYPIIFDINDTEEIIPAVTKDSINNLIDSMKKSKDKKFYFIVAKYNVVKEKLIDAGFVEKGR